MATKKRKKKRSLIQNLPSVLCFADGGAKQSTIEEMRTHVSNLSVLIAHEPKVFQALVNNGMRILAKNPRKGIVLMKGFKG